MYESSIDILNKELGDKELEIYYQEIPKNADQTLKQEQIRFWKRIIKKWIYKLKIAEFDLEVLEQYLSRGGFIPPLADSMQELIKEKILIKKSDFLQNRSFLRRLVSKLTVTTPAEYSKQFVCHKNLQVILNQFYDEHVTNSESALDLIVTNDQIRKYFPNISKEVIEASFESLKMAAKYDHGYYFESYKFVRVDSKGVASVLIIKKVLYYLKKKYQRLEQQKDKTEEESDLTMIQGKQEQIKQLNDYLNDIMNDIDEIKGEVPICNTLNTYFASNTLFIDHDINFNHPLFNLASKGYTATSSTNHHMVKCSENETEKPKEDQQQLVPNNEFKFPQMESRSLIEVDGKQATSFFGAFFAGLFIGLFAALKAFGELAEQEERRRRYREEEENRIVVQNYYIRRY